MTNIEKKESIKNIVENDLNKLEENNFSVKIEELTNFYSNLDKKNTDFTLVSLNNVISKDKNIINKWDFIKTFENIRIS